MSKYNHGAEYIYLGLAATLLVGIVLISDSAYAATPRSISFPYVVDEKPRVLFSDSAVVTAPTKTYNGLENYTQRYTNGYAHFTFTYTHNSCCTPEDSINLYVTDTDPRVSGGRSWLIALRKLDSGASTDWYSYDVQLDATGFRTVIKRAGETTVYNQHVNAPGGCTGFCDGRALGGWNGRIQDTDWAALLNIAPGTPSDYTVAFTPVPVKAPASQRMDPVIIVPGILGSANKNGTWIIDPVFHVYDNLIETLQANGYTKDVTLFPFGYDWRNSNVVTAELLKQKINEIKEICRCAKIDVVAHSMGGLVTRQYIESNAYTNDIDQLIFLGTPHKGAPKSYLIWEAGEFPDNFTDNYLEDHFNKEAKEAGYNNVFEYVRNRPIAAVQEILPMYNYLKDAVTRQLLPYSAGYPKNTFLEKLNAGIASLFASGIDITNIVGNNGTNTISTIRITHENKLPLWEHGYPQNYDGVFGDQGLEDDAGDDTVPEQSSKFGNVADIQISDTDHVKLPTDAQEIIYAKIHGGPIGSVIRKDYRRRMLVAKIFSPADFVVIAPNGKRVGKNFATNTEINEIPGSFYSGFAGDDEYVTIPDPLDGEYQIRLQGTGTGGYSFETTYISDTATETAEIQGTTVNNQITDLSLTVDSQHPEDITIETNITLETFVADINESYRLGWIKDVKTRDILLKKAHTIAKFYYTGVEKKFDKLLLKLIEKEIATLNKKGLLNKQGTDLLLKDLIYIYNHS